MPENILGEYVVQLDTLFPTRLGVVSSEASMTKPWDLEDGLRLIRALQTDCRQYGYHLTLGGGVLNKGRSDKDIDLYFLPLEGSRMAKADPDALIKWLTSMWGSGKEIGGDYDAPEPETAGGSTRSANSWWRSMAFDIETPNGAVIPMKANLNSVYKYKLKFVRKDGDRIDVFIS